MAGRREGLWTCWFENGVKESEMSFHNGKKDGLVKFWTASGAHDFESAWREGLLTGKSTYWYSGGKSKRLEADSLAGQLNGLLKEWHPNGQLIVQSEYKKNARHGFFQEWYPSGKKSVEARYNDNNLQGPYVEWHENGAVKKKALYRAGAVAEAEENFAPDGRKIASEPTQNPSNVGR